MNDPNNQSAPRSIPRQGLPGAATVILCLFLTLALAAAGIGICAMRTTSQAEVTVAEIVSGVALLLLTVYLWRTTRPTKGLIPLLVMTAVLLAYLTNSLIPAGVLLSVLFAISEGSVALAVLPRRHALWLPLLPLIAYVLTALSSRDPIGAVACLVAVPPALALAFGTRRSAERADGLTRVGVICITALVLSISLGGMIALSLYRHLGSLTLSTLMDALETWRASLITAITSLELPADATAEMAALISPESATNLVNSVFNILPGTLVATVVVLAAVIQFIQHAVLRTFGYAAYLTDRVRVFRMSFVSCLVFAVAYIVALVSGTEASTLAGTVAQNIYIILMPGLALAGLLRTVTGLTRRGARGMGCMFFFIILIPCLFLFAPFILAMVEVIGQIVNLITSRHPADDDPFSQDKS